MIDRDVLWVWLHLAKGVGPAKVNDLWTRLGERGEDLEDFFHHDAEAWARDFGLDARAVAGLADAKARIDEAAQVVETLRENNVRLLNLESPEFPPSLPASLGRKTPPLLYAVGNVDLLGRVGAAVVGARDASERGLRLARTIGENLARRGLVVVSGGARGTDTEAHRGALTSGGATIVVLGCGVLRFRVPSALGEAADRDSTLYLSELPPRQTWDAGGAMQRNRIVCALASALVVVEAGESGGTLHAASTARDLGRPVFVVQFAEYDAHSMGNPRLIQQGARPLEATGDPAGESWCVEVDPLVAAAEKHASRSRAARQTDLFS
jgi:DNA processing protein